MIDKQDVLEGIADPIKRYNNKMANEFSDWQPLEDAAALMLKGETVKCDELIPPFRPLAKMMRTIMEKTEKGAWDWADSEVQAVFKEVAEGEVYKVFSEPIVNIVTGIMKRDDIGTMLEGRPG